MGAVVGSVAIAEAGTAAPAPAPAPATPGTMSFADAAAPVDAADAILDEVLGGEPPADPPAAEPAKVDGEPKPDKLAEPPKTEPEAPPTNDVEAARLRKGFAKLAEKEQKLVELQNTARATTAAAQQYQDKARKYDEQAAAIESDPAAFLLAHGGEALVQKALQGFIDMEKSPAEREVAKFRKEQAERDARAEQAKIEQTASTWRNDIVAKVRADERFDLVNSLDLHAEVIGVMTGYYEKHSERDHEGNVTKPAILPWEAAAQAVEEHRAAMLDKSKRYGKRAPTAAAPETVPAKKDTPPAKQNTAPAKKAPTSLSSVPVAESPSDEEEDFSTDDLDQRQREVLASLGID